MMTDIDRRGVLDILARITQDVQTGRLEIEGFTWECHWVETTPDAGPVSTVALTGELTYTLTVRDPTKRFTEVKG